MLILQTKLEIFAKWILSKVKVPFILLDIKFLRQASILILIFKFLLLKMPLVFITYSTFATDYVQQNEVCTEHNELANETSLGDSNHWSSCFGSYSWPLDQKNKSLSPYHHADQFSGWNSHAYVKGIESIFFGKISISSSLDDDHTPYCQFSDIRYFWLLQNM